MNVFFEELMDQFPDVGNKYYSATSDDYLTEIGFRN